MALARRRRCGGATDRAALHRQPRWPHPDKYHVAALQQALAAARAAKAPRRARRSMRPTGCCRTRSSLMSTTSRAIQTSESSMSIRSFEAQAAVGAGRAARRSRCAVARRLCPQPRLDEPDLWRASPGARDASICQRPRTPADPLNLERARALPAASSATSSSTPPSSGSTCTRTASRSIRWSSSSATQISDADDHRLHPLRGLNPYWYVPPDLAAERIAPSSSSSSGLPYLDELGYQVLSDWDENPRSSIPRRSTGRRSPTARSKC